MIKHLCECGFRSNHPVENQGTLVRCKRCRSRVRLPADLSPEEILAELEKAQRERMHHYMFAHRILPEVAFADPKHVLELMKSDKAELFLRDLWSEVGSACPRVLSGEGLRVSLEPVEGFEQPVVLVHLPQPEIPPEAHFLAMVPSFDRKFFGLVKRKTVRCFTLERSVRLAGGTRTVVCEWSLDDTSALQHGNYGEGPSPTPSAFVEHLGAILCR